MESRTPVRPVRPAAAYVGGKRNLSRRLVDLIEADDHQTYAEPFVGMGGVFLRRRSRARAEVINDWSAEVATFFRILQRHYVPFMDMLRFQLTSREAFERLIRVDPTTLTDLERAARFIYVQRLNFGGRVTGRSFAFSRHQPGRFDTTKLAPLLEEIHDRLAGVIIERMPYGDFIRRYDSSGTLFFIDPPYWGNEDDYGQGMFSRGDFEALRTLLEGLQGRFILTINDRRETRAMFAAFHIEPVSVTYRLSGAATEGRELIIRGGGR